MVRKLKASKATSPAGNQADILKHAQDMQKQMLEIQEQLKDKELEVSVGGGAVIAKVTGQKELLSIKLSDDILKEAVEDKEMLEDLILSAVKEAMRQADELAEGEIGKVTGGVSIPGLL
jgi:DNA-binding YbaB/EbfC family protein